MLMFRLYILFFVVVHIARVTMVFFFMFLLFVTVLFTCEL